MRKVLVVDDTAFMRMILKDILKSMSWEEVIEAKDGEEAIELYKRHSPDIVTMDVVMPKMQGIEAAKKIKNLDPKAKIVMVTATGTQEEIMKEAMEAGAITYIIKPFKRDAVIKTLKEIA